jgi:hypothetical protein
MPDWPLPARGTPISPHWRSPEFEAELGEWCAGSLGHEVRLDNVKVRGWSAVWRVHAGGDVWYAKQNCPGQNFEAALVQVLAKHSSRVVPPTAVDLERGFLLTPDQGPVFGQTVGDDLEAWCAVAREGALLQRELADHVDEMEAAGLRRLGAAEAVSYVATRVEQYAALPAADGRHLSEADATMLQRLLPQVGVWAEQTAALGLPVTLNHNDLHENNVFAVDGGLRFFDFGDALLGEPLSALLVPLGRVKRRLECGPDDPRVSRIAEAALEVWSDVAPLTELRQRLDASLQLGKLSRSESWLRCLSHLTDDETAEFGAAEGYWLLALAEPPLVSG